jgi:hypothetical protein
MRILLALTANEGSGVPHSSARSRRTMLAYRNSFLCNTSTSVDFKAFKVLYLQHIRKKWREGAENAS